MVAKRVLMAATSTQVNCGRERQAKTAEQQNPEEQVRLQTGVKVSGNSRERHSQSGPEQCSLPLIRTREDDTCSVVGFHSAGSFVLPSCAPIAGVQVRGWGWRARSICQLKPRGWFEFYHSGQIPSSSFCRHEAGRTNAVRQGCHHGVSDRSMSAPHHGEVSAQLAQYAACFVRRALLRPNPPKTEGKCHSVSDCRLHVWGNLANGAQTTPHSVIMACSELLCQLRPHHSQLVIRSTMSQRSSEHLDPLFIRDQSRSFPYWLKAPCTCGDGLKCVASPWANAADIPHLDLPEVNSDVCVAVLMFLESGETVRNPLRCGHRVHIVWECQQSLCGSEVVLDCLQRSMLPKGEEEGHQWVALFASLTLHTVVDGAGIVFPEVRGLTIIEQTNEGKYLISSRHSAKGDEIVCTDAIN